MPFALMHFVSWRETYSGFGSFRSKIASDTVDGQHELLTRKWDYNGISHLPAGF